MPDLFVFPSSTSSPTHQVWDVLEFGFVRLQCFLRLSSVKLLVGTWVLLGLLRLLHVTHQVWDKQSQSAPGAKGIPIRPLRPLRLLRLTSSPEPSFCPGTE